jgi:hypothetical protein
MSTPPTANREFRDDDAADLLPLQFAAPSDWPAGLTLAFAETMENALQTGFPIVIPVRMDATPEQIGHVIEDMRALVERAGLAPGQPAVAGQGDPSRQ